MARSYVPEVPNYEASRTIALKGLRPGMAASDLRTKLPSELKPGEYRFALKSKT